MTPPDRNPGLPHELLLGQAGFLRRLARDLVRDPHAAEDAVQETWVAALEHPPRHDGNVRAWLGTILKNLVARRAQAGDRRVHHETRAAREGADTPATAGSGESVRFVTDAVLALEEPYQSTILARYFEDLSPSEIAKRQSVPVATVKSRLRRALEILRVRMLHTNGDTWRASLLALALPSKIGKGVFLVSLKTKLALVGATLIAGWFLYRAWTGSPSTPPSLASSGLDAAAVQTQDSSPPPAPDSVAKSAERSAPKPVAEEGSAATGTEPPDTLLYGAILDPSGAPWRGLLYEGVTLDDASGKSRFFDAQVDGTYAFHGLPFGSYWAHVDGDELLTVEKRIELGRDQPHLRCDFTASRAPRLKVKVTTPEGDNFVDAWKRARERDEAFKSLGLPFPVATLGPAEDLFKEGGPRTHGLNGVGWYWDFGPKVKSLPKEYMGVLILEHALPVRVSMVGNQRVLQTTTAEIGDEEVRFVLSLEQFLAGAATVSLQVVDAATLAPIRGARVDLEGETRSLHGWTSDANGMVLIRNHQPGEFQLRVSAPGHEDFTKVFSANPGTTTEFGQVALGDEIQFEARVLDATGANCSAGFKLGVLDPTTREITMEWRNSEELGDPTRETTTWKERRYGSDNDGVLRIRRLGRRVYVLRTEDVWRQSGQADQNTRWISGNILLDLRSGVAPNGMEIRLERASWLMLSVKGEEAAGLCYRVFAADGLERVDDVFRHSAPQSLPLPQGSYRVQLLDSGGRPLSEQTVTLGPESLTVELSR